MFSLVQRRRWYFRISAIVIALGVVLMLISWARTGAPLQLSNEFVGGTLYTLQFQEAISEDAIRDVFQTYGDGNVAVQRIGAPEANRWSVRAAFADVATSEAIIRDLGARAPLDMQAVLVDSVSPTVSSEVTGAAIGAVLFATLVVTGFIILAFRQVPEAWRYGMCAVIAMFHDVLIVVGFAALTGLLLGWEIDALFLTAVLTVVGFSVQDTIVVFDRIRENIPAHLGEPYETIVNRSVLETLHRSLATQLNAFFIMIAILLFGGDSLRQFIATLFIGLLSGTYSSIFIAVPLLVAWEKGELPWTKRTALNVQPATAGEGS
jgi:preprotein translocase SecF subunit